MHRIHLIISGDVQGVGYRAWVQQLARSKGINGWVKNREDGAVELVGEGTKSGLTDFIKCCQRGPDVAFVKHTDVVWEPATNEFSAFEVIY